MEIVANDIVKSKEGGKTKSSMIEKYKYVA